MYKKTQMASSGDVVFANSFSQPMVQFTSFAAPTPYAAIDFLDYDPNITKYVFYSLGPASGAALTKLVIVRGCPLNLAQNATISYSADYLVKTGTAVGAITTESTHFAAVSWEQSSPNSVPPNITSSEILMRMTCVAPLPVFAVGGISVLKMVINITVD